MASRKNVWRRRGNLEFRRATWRLHDGTPWGDVLWIRTGEVNGVRRVAYVLDRKEGKGAELGLSIYHKPNSRRDAVACGKAAFQHLKSK